MFETTLSSLHSRKHVQGCRRGQKNQIRAEKAKDEGNKAFRAKDYEKALQLYNSAIKLDPEKVILIFLYSSLIYISKQTNKLCPRHNRQTNANINLATSVTTTACADSRSHKNYYYMHTFGPGHDKKTSSLTSGCLYWKQSQHLPENGKVERSRGGCK